MGSRDKGKKETKKPKKDNKKAPVIGIMAPPPAQVEVYRKPRKTKEEEE